MFALALIAQAAAAAAAPALPVVFGMQLGAPIDLPECARAPEKYPTPGQPSPYRTDQVRTCEMLPPPLTPTKGGVWFDPAKIPEIVAGNIVGVTIEDGRLEAITAMTLGDSNAPAIVDKLTAKFGAPTNTSTETVIVSRVPLTGQRIVWVRPGFVVEYDTASTELNRGHLTIETARAHQERVAREARRDAERTPL
jgi:hypothetical protein